jgi:hypothetical protein
VKLTVCGLEGEALATGRRHRRRFRSGESLFTLELELSFQDPDLLIERGELCGQSLEMRRDLESSVSGRGFLRCVLGVTPRRRILDDLLRAGGGVAQKKKGKNRCRESPKSPRTHFMCLMRSDPPVVRSGAG